MTHFTEGLMLAHYPDTDRLAVLQLTDCHLGVAHGRPSSDRRSVLVFPH